MCRSRCSLFWSLTCNPVQWKVPSDIAINIFDFETYICTYQLQDKVPTTGEMSSVLQTYLLVVQSYTSPRNNHTMYLYVFSDMNTLRQLRIQKYYLIYHLNTYIDHQEESIIPLKLCTCRNDGSFYMWIWFITAISFEICVANRFKLNKSYRKIQTKLEDDPNNLALRSQAAQSKVSKKIVFK